MKIYYNELSDLKRRTNTKKIKCLSSGAPKQREKVQIILEQRHKFRLSILLEVANMKRSTYYYQSCNINKKDKC